jgi:hypothetical protein
MIFPNWKGKIPRSWVTINFADQRRVIADRMVPFMLDGFPGHQALLDRLGKHKKGQSCLSIKRLSVVDAGVLEQLCTESLAAMADRYPLR